MLSGREFWEIQMFSFITIMLRTFLFCHSCFPLFKLLLQITHLRVPYNILGGPVGVYLFGMLNDRAGRRISYFTCLTTLLVGSFLTALSVNFWMWTVSRVIVGLVITKMFCL